MNSAVVASVVAASVIGSLHCTSMCGGLVAFSTGGTERDSKRRALALAAYNATRGAGYVTLGTVAGALGSTLDRAGLRVGIGRVAGAVAGVAMLTWGIAKLVEAFGVHVRGKSRARVQVPLSNLIRKVRDQSPAVRSAVVGGCTAALPCGFLHAFLVAAAGTGSAFQGALVMAAFWLGTLPAVVGLGVGVHAFFLPLRRHAPFVGALVLVWFGLSSLLGRWSPAAAFSLPSSHGAVQAAPESPSHAR